MDNEQTEVSIEETPESKEPKAKMVHPHTRHTVYALQSQIVNLMYKGYAQEKETN